ncbi:MAG: sigma-70 family RNA polymerase sigma factor, partial [Pyrinomonadaceae bacterium]|nr:sigma-70 family RNA polymerase sigma factor [Pyrinomonadaceae bacterium]
MSLLAARKKDWTLTKEAFERLLGSLDANREHAGQKYEDLRRKLVEFFGARGSGSPSDSADETINRVARKMEEGETIQDLSRYCYGVARLLFMETVRARDKEPVDLDPATTPAAPDEEDLRRHDERERRLECLETCLNNLSSADHAFIVEYYRE